MAGIGRAPSTRFPGRRDCRPQEVTPLSSCTLAGVTSITGALRDPAVTVWATVTTEAISASSLAEVSWVVAGLPRVRGVVPLVDGDVPVLACTYAEEDLAREVAGSPVVTLSLTEPRSTGTAFRPLVIVGRPRLVEDPSGDLFATDLLAEELRRYPPSRLLADSCLLYTSPSPRDGLLSRMPSS